MILIDEKLPADPLHSEVVLHVRQHLRRRLRQGEGSPDDLALFFGLSSEEGSRLGFADSLKSPSPIHAAAKLIAAARTPKMPVVTLGHDDLHIAGCHEWLRQRRADEHAFDAIVATDLEMLLVLSKARDYATARTPDMAADPAIPILIEGETGTGKELLARAIHDIWARERTNGCSYHVVQVAGLPSDLINDELFGHTKGSYTGAHESRPGRLEEADGGTLLIDEIGDLPPAAQVRLLRFLQDQKLARTGTSKDRQVHVRILAATWHALDGDVLRGGFRQDLLHRVRVGWLRVPPLRSRPGVFVEVIPQLLGRMGQKAVPPITRSATEALALYLWPGNLRELVGVLRVALSSADGSTVRLEDLPPHLQRPYLDQPLYKRAPGFLSDESDGQELSESVASWRVSEVARSLEAVPPPNPGSEIEKLHGFFRNIPDASGEHQAVVQHLERSLALVCEQGQLAAFSSRWEEILAAPRLPEEVVRALALAQQELQRRREAVDSEIAKLSASTHLMDSPWFRLLTELRELPVFANEDPAHLLQGFIPLLQIVASFSPYFIETVKAFVSEGNIVERVRRFLPRLLEIDAIDQEEDSNAREWSAERWQKVMKNYPSKAAASRGLKLDTKTITGHLKRVGLKEKWSGG